MQGTNTLAYFDAINNEEKRFLTHSLQNGHQPTEVQDKEEAKADAVTPVAAAEHQNGAPDESARTGPEFIATLASHMVAAAPEVTHDTDGKQEAVVQEQQLHVQPEPVPEQEVQVSIF